VELVGGGTYDIRRGIGVVGVAAIGGKMLPAVEGALNNLRRLCSDSESSSGRGGSPVDGGGFCVGNISDNRFMFIPPDFDVGREVGRVEAATGGVGKAIVGAGLDGGPIDCLFPPEDEGLFCC
jgi:hypothetical protein